MYLTEESVLVALRMVELSLHLLHFWLHLWLFKW